MTVSPPLILASASPRRARYLRMLGLDFEVVPSGVAEHPRGSESPEGHVERLAGEKARAVAARRAGSLVLGGDTVVVFRGEILGKPGTREEAVEMLLRLEGRSHDVYSGLALVGQDGEVSSGVSVTRVTFRGLAPEEVEAYVDTGEPMDKAGSYGIQGLGASLVERLEGDYFTVAGLPVPLLVRLFERSGWRYAFGRLLPLRAEVTP